MFGRKPKRKGLLFPKSVGKLQEKRGGTKYSGEVSVKSTHMSKGFAPRPVYQFVGGGPKRHDKQKRGGGGSKGDTIVQKKTIGPR